MYTFARSGNGWTIRDADGKYLSVLGKQLFRSCLPCVWTLENGVFVSRPTVAVTLLGKVLTLGRTRAVYLNAADGVPVVSTEAGAAATSLKPVAAP